MHNNVAKKSVQLLMDIKDAMHSEDDPSFLSVDDNTNFKHDNLKVIGAAFVGTADQGNIALIYIAQQEKAKGAKTFIGFSTAPTVLHMGEERDVNLVPDTDMYHINTTADRNDGTANLAKRLAVEILTIRNQNSRLDGPRYVY